MFTNGNTKLPLCCTPAPLRRIAAALVREWVTLSPAARRAMTGEMVARIDVQSHGKSAGSGRATIGITSTWGEVYFYSI